MQGSTSTHRRKSAAIPNNNNNKSETSTPTNNRTPSSSPIPIAVVRRRKCGTGPFDQYWLNLDCCGLFCALFTYGLHLYAVYAVCWLLLPPWMSVNYEEGTSNSNTVDGGAIPTVVVVSDRHLTLWGQFHTFLFTTFALLAVLSHFKAMTTDPGAVPPDAKPVEDELQLQERDVEGAEPAAPKRKLCRRCNAFKPARAHHCSVCRRCIIKMDHHCPWVNNCVGIGNHKYFLLFVFYTCLSCIYSMALVTTRFIVCFQRHPGGGRHQHRATHPHCLDEPTHLLNMLGLIVEALLFGMFTTCMMVDQWDVVWTNMTHIDRLKGENMNVMSSGVLEAFGAKDRSGGSSFRADWLSPLHSVCFPANMEDSIFGYCRPCGRSNRSNDASIELGGTGGAGAQARMVKSVTEIV
jgi:hypothetical protein